MAQTAYSDEVRKWLDVVRQYDNEFKRWTQRADKIVKKYRDDGNALREAAGSPARFNILWSNVQTLVPAVYSRLPKADVSRRFADTDPVGRVAALLLERALDYEIEHYPDFRAAMLHSVTDRFLGGRGVAWARYEPHITTQDIPEDGLEITEDVEDPSSPPATTRQAEPQETIAYECAPTDYVNWKDFGHTVARTWEEVPQVWRWVYLSEEAATERFGEKAKGLQFNTSPDVKGGKDSKSNDKARICELWDKLSGKACWFSQDAPDLLDERDDPLGLDGFFPCGQPLYATLTTDSLVPVPDFCLYQDQATELDILTDRIDGLVRALRVRGVYDASEKNLQRLLTEGDNNTLIPVENWGGFSEKGGLKGVFDLIPINDFVVALNGAYQAQANIKGQIYEITGISDIIRGETAASETATAQQIKGQYAGLRLRSMQESVALFATDLLRRKAQIIATKYQPKTILAYAAADQLSPEDQQLIPQAMALLKSRPTETFRIEVAADSLVQLDEGQIKQERTEFLNAFANLLREAVPAGQATPALIPMLMASIKFGVSAYKGARQLEGAIDRSLDALQQQAANPPPNPEMQKAQMEAQAEQARMQADQQMEQVKQQGAAAVAQINAQSAAQLAQLKAQHESVMQAQKQDFERQLETLKISMGEATDRYKADLQSATAITVAQINAKAQADRAEAAANDTVVKDLEGESAA